MWETFFGGAFKLLMVSLGFVYGGLVLMAYRTEGHRYQLRLDWRSPAYAAAQLLVWLGVKALAAILRLGSAALDVLCEASAEVGEWYVRRRGGEVEATFRSRFL